MLKKLWRWQRDSTAASSIQQDVVAVEVARRLTQRLEGIYLKPKVIVELCGAKGLMAPHLSRLYPQAFIVNSELGLKEALLNKPLNKRHKSVVCQTSALALQPESAQLVIGNLPDMNAQQISSLAKEVKTLLAPGGLLLFSTFGPDTYKELRSAWQDADPKGKRVADFVDMHEIGDKLMQEAFEDPVMDVERLTLTYKEVNDFLHDLKSQGRQRSKECFPFLTGVKRFNAMLCAYQAWRLESGLYPVSYEITYGHAFKAKKPSQNHPAEVTVSLEQLTKKPSY